MQPEARIFSIERTVCRNEGLPIIAVDTSALMAILLGEANGRICMDVLEAETEIVISAGTVAEALIVAARRNVGDEMASLIDGLGFEIVTVTPAAARRIAAAYEQWGKGVHPAGLNFGDCFSYEVAKANSCRLLFTGGDFSKTDVAVF
jgi:ribonuclease VapC